MPCATVHLDVADRVLRRWDDGPASRTPFDASNVELRELFLHGALGPDMGYVPGVDRFVSDLAHYIRSADLARSLVSGAASARQVAYGWGWVTHVLADILIHPLIGRACGEILYGSRDLRLNSGAHIGMHVAVEVGLDATVLRSRVGIPAPPWEPVLRPDEAETLRDALGRVYGLDWRPAFLLRSHRKAVGMTRRWPDALRLVTRRWPAPAQAEERRFLSRMRGRVAMGVIGLAGRLPAPESSAYGMLRPLRPAPWLVEAVGGISQTFPERFQALVDGGLAHLPNHNLESGIPEDSGVQHPSALNTRLHLADLIRGVASTPGLVPAG